MRIIHVRIKGLYTIMLHQRIIHVRIIYVRVVAVGPSKVSLERLGQGIPEAVGGLGH